MIASERRIVTEGETRHSLTKKLALSGRPVKIYVIDPKQFQARLEKFTQPKKTDVKSSVKKTQKSEEPAPQFHSCETKNNYSTFRDAEDQYKMSRPILIAPKEGGGGMPSGGGTTIYFPPTTTLLPLQTMLPVSLSLPIMSVGTTLGHPGLGGTAVGNVISVPARIVGPLMKDTSPIKKKVLKKRPAKRKLTGEMSKRTSISEEKAEAAEMAFLMKESTTRGGRVSKSCTMASAIAATPSANTPLPSSSSGGSGTTNVSSQGKPKKREPSEKFRCQTCQKFYVGNAKFNQHFSKFPDHVKPDPNVKTQNKRNNSTKPLSPKSSSERQVTTSLQIDSTTNNARAREVAKSANLQTLSSDSSPSNSDLPFTSTAMDEDSFGIGALSPIMRRTTASVVNMDTLSDNCSSPKNLPVFNMASNPTMFPQRRNSIEQPNNLVHDSHSQQPQQSEYFMEFQTDFNNSSSNIGLSHQIPVNGSPESFNSLDNMLSDNNSHMGPCLQSPSIEPLTSRCNSTGGAAASIPRSSGSIGNSDASTFFSAASTALNTSSDLRHHLHNSSVNVSSYISVNSCRNPVPSVLSSPFRLVGVDDESREACMSSITTAEEKDGLGIQTLSPTNHGQPKCRSIWEFVKEQIRLCGINQTCGEISEMADKLSKIARDKFYPIQEEEVERLGTASPVIQVGTPFISHLLDLPFGTYVFKEDGGIRKIIPPPTPVSTELSLTNGVEVDVTKFLSPDIDLISLPHLTNLDFNSICN